MTRRRKQTEDDWTKQPLDLDSRGEPPRADDPYAGDAPPVDDRDALPDPAGSGVDPFAEGGGGTAAGGDPGETGADPEGYAPIAVGDLESRVEGGAHSEDFESGPDHDPGDVADEAGREVAMEHGAAPGVSEAETDDADDAGDGFALESEDAYDYGIGDESGPEAPAGEIFSRGTVDQPRRLPIALVAVIGVVVAVTAFVVGVGWMGGDDGDPALAPADTVETPPGAEAGREFSEAVVGEPDPDPVPVPEPAAGGTEFAAAPPAAAPDPLPAASPAAAPDLPAAAPDPPSPAPNLPPAAPTPRPSPPVVSEPDPPPPPPSPEASPPLVGRLLVRSMPPGAEVVVNGEPRGTTPLALAGLPYGSYDVEVTLAGYGSRRVQLVLDEGDPIGRFSADLTAPPAEPPAARSAPAGAEGGIGSSGRDGRGTRAAAVDAAPAIPARVAASFGAAAR